MLITTSIFSSITTASATTATNTNSIMFAQTFHNVNNILEQLYSKKINNNNK